MYVPYEGITAMDSHDATALFIPTKRLDAQCYGVEQC